MMMKSYIAVVHKDENSAYGVSFPDVPGCFSAADEPDELLKNAAEALALFLEGDTAPPARSIEEIRAISSDDLAEGAYLMAVPQFRLSGRSAKANITMDAGLLAAVDQTAKERGLTRSAFLADLARQEIAGE